MSRELDEKELGQISGGQAAAVSRLRCGHFSIATLSACDPQFACARLRTRRAVGFAPLAQRWRSRSPRVHLGAIDVLSPEPATSLREHQGPGMRARDARTPSRRKFIGGARLGAETHPFFFPLRRTLFLAVADIGLQRSDSGQVQNRMPSSAVVMAFVWRMPKRTSSAA